MSAQQYGPYCHPGGVRSYGNADEGVMLLGIAPGRNEMREGRPFIGESGRLLDAILDAVGWSRDKVYTTNLYCQHNDNPTPEMIALCAPRLRQEIRDLKPKILMPLGKLATETVIPDRKFGNVSGGVFWTENVLDSGHSCYVIPTFHPAAILYGMSMYVHDVYRDLRRIKTVLEWEPGAPHTKVEYFLAESTADAQHWLDYFRDTNPDYMALDIESASGKDADESFDPHSDKLLCVGLSNGKDTVVIPEEFCHGLVWPTELNWTYHWSIFDHQGIRRYLGPRLRIAHDTLLMSFACDERTGVHALKKILREQLGYGFYEDEAHRQAKMLKGFDKIDKAVLYKYNAIDVCGTARVAPLLHKQMEDDGQLRPYYDIMIPTANAFADMQWHGVRVDMKRLNELEKVWYPEWMEMDERLRTYGVELGAPAPFNPNSDKQLKHLVYDILGIKSPTGKVSAKTGVQALDKEVLELLEGAHPFIDGLHDFRRLDHVIQNYVFVVRDNIKYDGLLHATPKQHGAITYRTSYIDPPLQTIPNPKYDSNRYGQFREVFVPRDAGHCIGEVDFSKAELYWGAQESGDDVMRADLLSGDFHRRTASDIFNKPMEDVTKWDRTRSKHVTFGIMYGRGARALAKGELKCNIAEAEVFLNRWKWRYKRYMEWAQEVRKKAIMEGELVSFTGRKRRFKLILDGDQDMLNKAVNFPIQSAASDTTLKAMCTLCAELPQYDSFPIIMIHDSLVFDLSEAHLAMTLPLIKRVMESPQFPGAPSIEVELAIGPNWGQTKEVEVDSRELVYAT